MGESLRSNGRDAMLALLAQYLAHARAAGLLTQASTTEAEVLIALALRDWQIERLLGRMPVPTARRINVRAKEAVALFMRPYAV